MNERNPIHTVVMDMTRAVDIAHWLSDELSVTMIDRSQGNAMAALDYEHSWRRSGRVSFATPAIRG